MKTINFFPLQREIPLKVPVKKLLIVAKSGKQALISLRFGVDLFL